MQCRCANRAVQGPQLYLDLLVLHLAFVGEHLKADDIPMPMKDLHRGTLRLLLVLHHDFPEFLAEHHYTLLNAIPSHCIQMRSLIISAVPHPDFQLPDPLAEGLDVERLDEIKRVPVIRADLETPLRDAQILEVVRKMVGAGVNESGMDKVVDAISKARKQDSGVGGIPYQVDVQLIHALVLFLVRGDSPMTFSATSSQAQILEGLMQRLTPEGRHYLISAIVDQLRYPNNHTHYFGQAVFHLFRDGQTDAYSMDMKMQIIRVLLERLIAHRPHSWGLIVTLMELLKNRDYRFWELPFIKNTPEVCLAGEE